MRSPVVDDLAAAVDAVAAVDVSGLSVEQLQQLAGQVRLHSGRLTGIENRALAELSQRTGGHVPDRPGSGTYSPVHAWWRDAARTSGPAAGAQVRAAEALRELPLIAGAVVTGRLTPEVGRLLARLVGPIDPQTLRDCQPELLQVITGLPPDAVARQVAHWLATFCEPALDADDEQASRRRRLHLHDQHNGSHRGTFQLPDGDIEVLRTVLEALSRSTGEHDDRSAAQRRADTLIEVFDLARRHAELPDTGGAKAHLAYVIAADWLTRHHPTPLTPNSLLATSGPGTTPGQPLHPAVPPSGRPHHPAPASEPGRAAEHGQAAQNHADADADKPGRASDPAEAGTPGQITGPADNAAAPVTGCAEGAWTGPQTRARIHAVLCDCRRSRIVLDPIGQVRGLEALGDTVTRTQRRALVARDRHCTARGCTRPPAYCDAHHLQPLADGGVTQLGNLVLLCRRHHMLWHQQQLTLTDLHVPWQRNPLDHAPP